MRSNEMATSRVVPRIVVGVAVSLVAFSFLNSVLLSVMLEPTGAKLGRGVTRLLLTCIVAYFLYRGFRWARIITVGFAVFAVLVSLVGFFLMPEAVSLFYRVGWLITGLFYGTVAFLLLFSSDVQAYFRKPRAVAKDSAAVGQSS